MTAADVTYDNVLALARRLRPVDQARLVAQLAPVIEHVAAQADVASPVHLPLRGMLADLGAAPSEEDIAEVQRDMWSLLGNNAA